MRKLIIFLVSAGICVSASAQYGGGGYSSASAVPVEGTAVLSTGETGGTKVLTEDGTGSSTWAAPGVSVEVDPIAMPAINTVSGRVDVVEGWGDHPADASTNLVNALSLNRQTISTTSDGATITATIDAEDASGTLVYYFSGVPVSIAVPTNVTLNAGTSSVPQDNWIYVNPAGDVLVSTTRPSGERALMARISVRSATDTQTEGAFAKQRKTEAIDLPDGRSRLSHMGERIRVSGAMWESGALASVAIESNGAAEDNVLIGITSGEIWQIHRQTFGAVATNQNEYFVMNDTNGVTRITDLNQIDHDASGNSTLDSNNRYFNVQVIAYQASGNGNTSNRVMLTLSTDDYGTLAGAIGDTLGQNVTSVSPQYFGGAVWLATVTLRRQSTAGGTWTATVTDRRGVALNSNVSGSGATAQAQTFPDANFRVFDDVDPTKLVAFEASGITTGTTRTYTWPDKNGTVAMTSDITGGGGGDIYGASNNTFTATNTFTKAVLLSTDATTGEQAVNYQTMEAFEWVTAPASNTAAGTQGQKAYDDNYFYIAISNNVWRRTTLASW